MKGEFYRHLKDTVRILDEKTGGGVGRNLAKGEVAVFMQQEFLAATLYDILPIPFVTTAIADAIGREVHEFTARLGKSSLDIELRGVYKSMVGPMSAENFHTRFPAIMTQFYDHGPMTVQRHAGGKRASLQRRDMPLCVCDWWSLISLPYLQIPLQNNGAKNVQIVWRTEVAGSEREGVRLGHVHWDIVWE